MINNIPMIFFKSKRGMSFINKAGAPNKRKTADTLGVQQRRDQFVIGPNVAFQKSQREAVWDKKRKKKKNQQKQ